MKKTRKPFKTIWPQILLWVIAAVAVGVIGSFALTFYGNPVSHLLLPGAAERYLKQNYSHLDVEVTRTGYNFKDGNYYAHISSPTSVDTHFSVSFDGWGRAKRDTYDSVTEGFNTWERLDAQYRDLVREVLKSPDFPYPTDIGYGTLEDEYTEYPWSDRYGLSRQELILDGVYDIRELGAKHGSITLYVYEENITCRRGAEILADVDTVLEEKNVPFYAINFVLRRPKEADKPRTDEDMTLRLMDFPHSEIPGEGLEERVRLSHERTMAYYAEQDKLK